MESTPIRDGDFDIIVSRVTELKDSGWKESSIMGYLRPSFPGMTRDMLRDIMRGQPSKGRASRA